MYIKFHKNPSIGSRVVPCGRAETDRQTDMTQPAVAFRNSANAPNGVPASSGSVHLALSVSAPSTDALLL